MAKIGDFFDDAAKEASIESQLKIGVVLKLRVILSSGTKEKRIIVIGFNSDRSQLAFVTINSDVNRPYLRNRPILRALQVELKISGFLRRICAFGIQLDNSDGLLPSDII